MDKVGGRVRDIAERPAPLPGRGYRYAPEPNYGPGNSALILPISR
jgi:hypothetical protein